MMDEIGIASLEVDPDLVGRRITADYIADSVRRAINEGDLADGTQLNQVELASHFGVSRVPVREALRQLQAEGLIDSQAHRLVSVRGTDMTRLGDVFSLRALLEGWLVERAVPNVTAEMVAQAREINAALREEEHHPSWLKMNTQFHSILFSAANSAEAMNLLQPLRMKSQRYSRLWSHGEGVHRPLQSCTEHDAILDLILAGDAAGARDASTEHVMHTREAVIAAGRTARGSEG